MVSRTLASEVVRATKDRQNSRRTCADKQNPREVDRHVHATGLSARNLVQFGGILVI